jgi:uncharacterized protein YjbI with pentapeptide repeats
MPEDSPTCQIHKHIQDLMFFKKCVDPALDGDLDGYCILHSQNPDKDPEAFKEALRARWEQEDKQFYDLRAVFFPGPFDSYSEDFCGSTGFPERADFSRATFMKGADFSLVVFARGACFFQATFAEGAKFFGDIFMGVADFSRATISGQIVFQYINPGGEPFRGDFSFLTFNPQAVLSFQGVPLSKITFRGTDLRRVEFHHVQWHPYRGRQAVYDEVLLRQEEKENPRYWHWFLTWVSCHLLPLQSFALEGGNQLYQYLEEEFSPPDAPRADEYGEVERLYRNLKLNYEGAGDFKNAGDFHYGEMEMHRQASRWRWFPFYWYNLYWALSGYGERPSRALGWLAAFLAIFTIFLAWAGLEILDPKHVPAFGDSFFYLLQKVTLQRPTWAEPQGFWGKLVGGFSVLLLPGQAALFLLALRNRLGRRR